MKPEILLLTLVAIASACISVGTTTVDAEVGEVVDGDTVIAEFGNRSEVVRLRGIDTPEVNSENNPFEFEGVSDSEEARECLRRYGENASSYLKKNIGGSSVEIEFTKGIFGRQRGGYGRLLGVVYHDNKSLNRELVEKGLARSYTEDGPYFDEEVRAKLEMKGVWNCQRVS